jgi:hypothetical protein
VGVARTIAGMAWREADLEPLTGSLAQLASVRRFTFDDGPEHGVRGLAFDTGGGLAFAVLVDRSLDIASLSWRGIPCAWQSPTGFRHPGLHDADAEAGRGFLRSFSGFLVTCGLDHVRQPRDGRPLHGRLPFTPARLTACGECWDSNEPHLFAEAEIIQATADGENWRLRRRIEAPIGGSAIRLIDTVTNRSREPRPQPILYHMNLGFPLLRPGAELFLGDDRLIGPCGLPDAASGPEVSCRRLPGGARLTLRTPGDPPMRLALEADASTLPFIQTWHDSRPGMYVLGVEPCNADRAPDGTTIDNEGLVLPAGASRRYTLAVTLA